MPCKWDFWVHLIISFGDFSIGIFISILFTRRLMMLGMSTKKRTRNRMRTRSELKTSQNKGSLGTSSRLSLPGLSKSKSNSRRTLSIDNIRILKRHPTPNSLQKEGESDMEIDLTRIVIDADGKVMDSSDYAYKKAINTNG